MKPAPFRYVAPSTVDDAVAVLAAAGHGAKVLAGGQSLVPLLNMRLVTPSMVVDINRIPGLDSITVTNEAVTVGATARHAQVLDDREVRGALPLIGQALEHVAHGVIRNRGTCVGSIVHADPAAELPAVLALTGGSIRVAGPQGIRDVGIEDLFIGPMESAVGPAEVAVSATFPRFGASVRTAVRELARRHGDYAMAGVAVAVEVVDDLVASARAAFIGVTDVPGVVDLSDDLVGQPARDPDVAAALATADLAIDPVGDIHATAAYRRHLAGVLLDRALRAAGADVERERGAA